jgi:hypothetical protein
MLEDSSSSSSLPSSSELLVSPISNLGPLTDGSFLEIGPAPLTGKNLFETEGAEEEVGVKVEVERVSSFFDKGGESFTLLALTKMKFPPLGLEEVASIEELLK